MTKQTVVVNVRLAPDEVERIDEIARADDRSRGYIIRKFLRESLDALQGNGEYPSPGTPAMRTAGTAETRGVAVG